MQLLGQNEVDYRQKQVVILSQDSFYRVLTSEQKAKALKGQFNFDHPGELGVEGCVCVWKVEQVVVVVVVFMRKDLASPKSVAVDNIGAQ